MIFKKRSKTHDDNAPVVAAETPVISEEAPIDGAQEPAAEEKKKKKKKEKSPKTARPAKQIKLSKKPQYILSIGDEGVILVYLKDQKVEGRWFAADASEEQIGVLSKAAAMNPKAPLTIVLDTIDQHYSQQTLPPVSKMSVGGLLKRRSNREFGRSMELQGNYFLSRSESKEWNYMMFAVEVAEHVQDWIDWTLTLPNPPRGIRLLPLEMKPLMDLLAKSHATGFLEEQKAEKGWQYFVSYNKISGVRQIILRDGKMIFTRLGQPLEGDAQTEAGGIEQEIISTVEYLKRIGLKTIHDLQLYLLAGEDIIQAIDAARIGVDAHMLLSPSRVSNILGWEGVARPEDRFGDVLLATFVVNNKKSAHVLWTKPLQKIKQLYLAIPAVRVVGGLSALVAIGLIAMSAYGYWGHSQAISDRAGQKRIIKQEYAEMQATVDLPPEELSLVLELFDVFKSQESSQANPKEFLLRTSQAMTAMPEHMRLQSIAWRRTEGKSSGGAPPAAQPNIGMGGMDLSMMGGGAVAPIQAQGGAKKKASSLPPTGAVSQSVAGQIALHILVPSDINREDMMRQAGMIVGQLAEHYPYYSFALQSVPETPSVSDSIDIDFSGELVEKKIEQQRITIGASFKGVDYISEPIFEASE